MTYRWRSVAVVAGGVIADQLLKALYRPERAFANTDLLGTATHPTVALTVTCIALAILAWLWWRVASHPGLLNLGLSLTLAGGASNVADRILRGAIIDPFTLGTLSFNLADGLLGLGALLVLLPLTLPIRNS